jgi:hypothetical protein
VETLVEDASGVAVRRRWVPKRARDAAYGAASDWLRQAKGEELPTPGVLAAADRVMRGSANKVLLAERIKNEGVEAVLEGMSNVVGSPPEDELGEVEDVNIVDVSVWDHGGVDEAPAQ